MEVNQLQQYFGTWQEFLRSVEILSAFWRQDLENNISFFASNPMLHPGRTVGDHKGPGDRTNNHSEPGSLASLEERAAWTRALL